MTGILDLPRRRGGAVEDDDDAALLVFFITAAMPSAILDVSVATSF